jgi:hypothetical protein
MVGMSPLVGRVLWIRQQLIRRLMRLGGKVWLVGWLALAAIIMGLGLFRLKCCNHWRALLLLIGRLSCLHFCRGARLRRCCHDPLRIPRQLGMPALVAAQPGGSAGL